MKSGIAFENLPVSSSSSSQKKKPKPGWSDLVKPYKDTANQSLKYCWVVGWGVWNCAYFAFNTGGEESRNWGNMLLQYLKGPLLVIWSFVARLPLKIDNSILKNPWMVRNDQEVLFPEQDINRPCCTTGSFTHRSVDSIFLYYPQIIINTKCILVAKT